MLAGRRVRATHVLIGAFIDTVLDPAIPFIDRDSGRWSYWGDPGQSCDFTSVADTGRYGAAVAAEPEAPEVLRFAGGVLTMPQLSGAVARATGRPVSATRLGDADDLARLGGHSRPDVLSPTACCPVLSDRSGRDGLVPDLGAAMNDARLDPFRDRLSVENAAMLLIDHQEGFFPGIKSIDTKDMRNNIVALAKIAARTKMPTVLTSSFAEGINGRLMPEVVAQFPGLPIINRHLVNCWDDPAYVAAVKATGRTKLIMSALTTDVCLVFPAVAAAREGFEVYCVLDASGAWSKRAEDACILRMNNAGCVMTTWVSVGAELLHDHLGPHKQAVQSVFNEHLFGYEAQDDSGMTRDGK